MAEYRHNAVVVGGSVLVTLGTAVVIGWWTIAATVPTAPAFWQWWLIAPSCLIGTGGFVIIGVALDAFPSLERPRHARVMEKSPGESDDRRTDQSIREREPSSKLGPNARMRLGATVCDFFISYTSADAGWAEWIGWQLEASGYAVRLQKWDFLPGADFVQQMDDAIADCARLIAVVSSHYLSVSKFGWAEWHVFFANDPVGEKRSVIPIHVEPTAMPGLLGTRVHTDLFGLSENEARSALLSTVAPGRRKPATAPVFPATHRADETPTFPGSRAVTNLSRDVGPAFVGRSIELTRLKEVLFGSPSTVVAIVGLGGIGKTRLAREYAKQYHDSYRLVWFLSSNDVDDLNSGLATLLAALSRDDSISPTEVPLTLRLAAELATLEPWLMIVDNAKSVSPIVDLLPPDTSNHIIFTSQDSTIPADVRISLGPLESSASEELITSRSGRDEPENAMELNRLLNGLPLAIEQAAGYIDATATSIADYLELYRERSADLLRRTGSESTETVATTWHLAFSALSARSDSAVSLMRNIAVFASDEIPRRLLVHPPDLGVAESSPRDPVSLNEAVLELRRFSLIDADPSAVSMHNVLAQVVRDSMTEPELRAHVEVAIAMVVHDYDARRGIEAADTLSHLITLARVALKHAQPSRLVRRLFIYAADAIADVDPRFALHVCGEASKIPREPQDDLIPLFQWAAGKAFVALGDMPRASVPLREALELTPTTDPLYGTRLLMYASVSPYVSRAEAVKARTLVVAELDRLRLSEADDRIYLANVLAALGVIDNIGLNDLPSARASLEEALSIAEAARGRAGYLTVSIASELSFVVLDLGDAPLAYDILGARVSELEEQSGELAVLFGPFLSNRARILLALGRVREAERDSRRILAHRKDFYGEMTMRTAASESNLARILLHADADASIADRVQRTTEAIALLEHAKQVIDALETRPTRAEDEVLVEARHQLAELDRETPG